MSYYTGNFPLLSNTNYAGFLPPVFSTNLRNNSRMSSREDKIEYIKKEMKSLGWKPRSLSMHLFGKPDRIRNLLSGKATHWRSDTEEAVMEVFKNKIANPKVGRAIKTATPKKEMNSGVVEAIKGIAQALTASGLVDRRYLAALFNDSLQDLRAHNQSDGVEVLSELLESLHLAPSSQDIPVAHISLQPERDQYLKRKKSEDPT